MTLQLIRRDGKVCGIVLLGEGEQIVVTRKGELWRICESCGVREALAFCCTHAKYICQPCLEGAPDIHRRCRFISNALARELARQFAEVEAS